MGPIARSKVSLRISGEKFTENQINVLLEVKASEFLTRNIPDSIGGTGIKNQWCLSAPEGIELEEQISWLFNKATKDLNKWRILTDAYDVDIFCGAFMESENEGIQFDCNILKMACDRNTRIGVDIYAPD